MAAGSDERAFGSAAGIPPLPDASWYVGVRDPDVSRAQPLARGIARIRDAFAADSAPRVAESDEPIGVGRRANPEEDLPPATTAERRMVDLMNAARASAGLVPLAWDENVARVARLHSAAEAAVGYVYHDGADGTAGARNAATCRSGWFGENTGKIWDQRVDTLHHEFMAEPNAPINHRSNILDPAFRRVGVGAVFGRDAMYMTMVFCR